MTLHIRDSRPIGELVPFDTRYRAMSRAARPPRVHGQRRVVQTGLVLHLAPLPCPRVAAVALVGGDANAAVLARGMAYRFAPWDRIPAAEFHSPFAVAARDVERGVAVREAVSRIAGGAAAAVRGALQFRVDGGLGRLAASFWNIRG